MGAAPNMAQILREDWPMLLVYSVCATLIGCMVDYLAHMAPTSPWTGLVAALPVGFLAAAFVSSADLPLFLRNYARASLAVTIAGTLFALAASKPNVISSHHAMIPTFLCFWMLLNICLLL